MEPVAAQTHFICIIIYKIDVWKDADALLLTLHLPTSNKIHRVTSLLLWAYDRIYKTQLIKLFTRFSSFLRLPQSPSLLISGSAKLAFVKNFELELWASLFFPQPGAREKSPVVCNCQAIYMGKPVFSRTGLMVWT